jgi:hypothetical protein
LKHYIHNFVIYFSHRKISFYKLRSLSGYRGDCVLEVSAYYALPPPVLQLTSGLVDALSQVMGHLIQAHPALLAVRRLRQVAPGRLLRVWVQANVNLGGAHVAHERLAQAAVRGGALLRNCLQVAQCGAHLAVAVHVALESKV